MSDEVLKDLLAMWKQDAVVDRTDPAEELTKIGSLHAKYLCILSENRQSIKVLDKNFKRVKKLKWEYYTGKTPAETLKKLGWEPFPYLLKADIAIYLDADKDLLDLVTKRELHEEIVEVCTSIIKELNSRTYQMKDIITWERFTSGA